jgi:CDP-diacylglycerol--serine O-phosphatidyltransferase
VPGDPRSFRFKFRRRRVRYVALLPTVITLCNGICGMLAICFIAAGLFRGDAAAVNVQTGAYLILIGMIFDALDGKVARVTRTASSFGAQLDSLCDLVAFGVAPGFLVYAAALRSGSWLPERIVLVVSVFYAMCALIRLARFTVETTPDEKSHLEFQGLPSPAAAGVIAAALVPWHAFNNSSPVLQRISEVVASALPVVAFLLGVLMVSRIRYMHVVNRLFRGFRPFVALVELALAAILIVIFYEFALFLGFVAYAVAGPVMWAVNRLLRRPGPQPAPAAASDGAAPPEEPLF